MFVRRCHCSAAAAAAASSAAAAAAVSVAADTPRHRIPRLPKADSVASPPVVPLQPVSAPAPSSTSSLRPRAVLLSVAAAPAALAAAAAAAPVAARVALPRSSPLAGAAAANAPSFPHSYAAHNGLAAAAAAAPVFASVAGAAAPAFVPIAAAAAPGFTSVAAVGGVGLVPRPHPPYALPGALAVSTGSVSTGYFAYTAHGTSAGAFAGAPLAAPLLAPVAPAGGSGVQLFAQPPHAFAGAVVPAVGFTPSSAADTGARVPEFAGAAAAAAALPIAALGGGAPFAPRTRSFAYPHGAVRGPAERRPAVPLLASAAAAGASTAATRHANRTRVAVTASVSAGPTAAGEKVPGFWADHNYSRRAIKRQKVAAALAAAAQQVNAAEQARSAAEAQRNAALDQQQRSNEQLRAAQSAAAAANTVLRRASSTIDALPLRQFCKLPSSLQQLDES